MQEAVIAGRILLIPMGMIRTRKDLDSCVYPLREITESVGFLKIRKNSNLLIAKLKSLEWEDLKKNREKWLNFKQEDEIKKWSK